MAKLGVSVLIGLLSIFFLSIETSGAQPVPASDSLKEVQISQDVFTLGGNLPAWVEAAPVPSSDQNQPIVIRLAETQFLVGPKPAYFVHRAVQARQGNLPSELGQLSIAFAPQYQKLTIHRLTLLRGGEVLDRTRSSTIRFLEREAELERRVYSGVVTASVLVNDVRAGDTLEYAYTLAGRNPVFGDRYSEATTWDQEYPTTLRRVVVNFPVDRSIAWRVVGDRQVNPLLPTDATNAGMRKLVFEQKDMLASVAEPQTPGNVFQYRLLQISEYAGWDEVGSWASSLFLTNEPLGKELRQVVEKIRSASSEEERIVKALEFVQSEIRYFSVSLGESSHRPTNPDLVFERRYGDCKDKSLMLISLLKELGIASKPVLLQYGRRGGLEKLLPTPDWFDHVIVQVALEGRDYFLDPTREGQHGRLSTMGQLHEGAQILVASPQGGRLSAITSGNPADRSELTESVSLKSFEAEASFQTHYVWSGVAAEEVRVLLARSTIERIGKTMTDTMDARYPGTKLVRPVVVEDDLNTNTFSVSVNFSVPKIATEKETYWTVSYVPGNLKGVFLGMQNITSSRSFPLDGIRYPFHGKYSFEVTFPESVTVVMDPSVVTSESKLFTFVGKGSFRGNVMQLSVDLNTLTNQIGPEDIPLFRSQLQVIGDALPGGVYVRKSAINSGGAEQAKPKSLSEMMRNAAQERIDKVSETIKSGKLGGKDLAEAYCIRGESYADIGQFDLAKRDADEAIKLAPNSPYHIGCRAYAMLAAGDFEACISDYTRALSLGGANAHLFRMRGVARLYTKQLNEAADDFLESHQRGNSESRMYGDLWLAFIYRRLGRSLPADVEKAATENSGGDWPMPALAMLYGKITPEQMLATLSKKTGDDQRMALAEGYFYIGQHYLAAGDSGQARMYFEKSREQGAIVYTEHWAAQFELDRLKQR